MPKTSAAALPVDIYVRVSRRGDRPDEKFHSPEEQEAIARAYARDRGLEIGVVLPPDIDRSGGTTEREGLREGLRRAKEGKSAGIVVAWLDRFSRDAAQAYDLLREFEDSGGRVWAPDAPDDYATPEGELQLGIFLLFAQYTRKRARAGFDRAKLRAVTTGVHIGHVPVGYRKRKDRRLEPDPDTAPVVRELFERAAAGKGAIALTPFMDERAPRPEGAKWTRNGVAGVLRNPVYLGRLVHGEFANEDSHEAIVDEPTWLAAQAARRQNNLRPKRAPDSPWLLTGLAVCGACERRLAPWRTSAKHTRKDNGHPWRRYRCPNRACSEPASIDADRLEAQVTADVFAFLGARLEQRVPAPDLSPLIAEAERARRRFEHTKAPEAQDALGDAWYSEVKQRRTDYEAAAAALGEAQARAGGPEPGEADDLRERWGSMSVGERRDALRDVYGVRAVIVSRGARKGGSDARPRFEQRVEVVFQ